MLDRIVYSVLGLACIVTMVFAVLVIIGDIQHGRKFAAAKYAMVFVIVGCIAFTLFRAALMGPKLSDGPPPASEA
jgi:hypothetical protein